MFTKLGISTTSRATKAERRTIAPGTARKPASRKRFSPHPANLDGILSHQVASPGPPPMIELSLRRNDKSTAFFSHWLTFQEFGPAAPAIFSATRALPESRVSKAFSTASRTSPVVWGLIAERFSQA